MCVSVLLLSLSLSLSSSLPNRIDCRNDRNSNEDGGQCRRVAASRYLHARWEGGKGSRFPRVSWFEFWVLVLVLVLAYVAAIHPSTHLSIYLSIYLSVYRSTPIRYESSGSFDGPTDLPVATTQLYATMSRKTTRRAHWPRRRRRPPCTILPPHGPRTNERTNTNDES